MSQPSLPLQKFVILGVKDTGVEEVLILDEVSRIAAKVVAVRQGFRWCLVLTAAEASQIAAAMITESTTQ